MPFISSVRGNYSPLGVQRAGPGAEPLVVEYVVVAGGGSGGAVSASSGLGGGGGAGGYRSSVSGESSGGGAAAESPLSLLTATNYTVTVGAGGNSVGPGNATGLNGANSVFATITSTGGGGGSPGDTGTGAQVGGSGGGGGGGGGSGPRNPGAAGTANQGFAGGNGSSSGQNYPGGGGGGAGGAGQTFPNNLKAGDGGIGVPSGITGSWIWRAGGGGGGTNTVLNGAYQGEGGLGGGGDGGHNNAGLPGLPNTGGGGGGAGGDSSSASGAGGSGVVIIRYPSDYSVSNPGGGLTFNTILSGDGKKITAFTAGTGNIQFALDFSAPSYVVEYLVVAGGGSGGGNHGGGGGAGGYLSSSLSEPSGAASAPLAPQAITLGTNYTVTVGAGGATYTGTTGSKGNNGSNSVFAGQTAIGGGGGGDAASSVSLTGGSGGGTGYGGSTTAGTANQGTAGGSNNGTYNGGGGGARFGGYWCNGPDKTNYSPIDRQNARAGRGGLGLSSSITGSPVFRAGGGGAGGHTGDPGFGGIGFHGGGDGGDFQNAGGASSEDDSQSGLPGFPNTGGGGGGNGKRVSSQVAGAGGSGIVVLKYPSTLSLSNPGGGLTFRTTSNGSFKFTAFTAGTGNVQFAADPTPVNVVEYVVIGGGGGGSSDTACCVGHGGGGAGGYRSSVVGEPSGGGAVGEAPIPIVTGLNNYSVTIASGGTNKQNGGFTVFSSVSSLGGGYGGFYSGTSNNATSGGSGGGAPGPAWGLKGSGTAGQGFDGGDNVPNNGGGIGGANSQRGSGGGGAGSEGLSGSNHTGRGGVGLQSGITGTPTYRAGGGGGGVRSNAANGEGGLGGLGGGGSGRAFNNAIVDARGILRGINQQNGLANTGGGAGGGAGGSTGPGTGGSGVVIFRYPSTFTISNPGGGLTTTTATYNGFKVTTITAGTGNIEINSGSSSSYTTQGLIFDWDPGNLGLGNGALISNGTSLAAGLTANTVSGTSIAVNGGTPNYSTGQSGHIDTTSNTCRISVTGTNIAAALNTCSSMTVTCWFQSNGASRQVLVSRYGTSFPNQVNHIVDPTGDFHYNSSGVISGASGDVDNATNYWQNNTWHLCHWVYNVLDGVARWYIDGAQVATVTFGTDSGAGLSVPSSSSGFGIMSRADDFERLVGRIGPVRIHNIALTTTQISNDWTAQRARFGV